MDWSTGGYCLPGDGSGPLLLCSHVYIPEESRIIYRSKDNRQEKAFDALGQLV
jgi:hypothetical protein